MAPPTALAQGRQELYHNVKDKTMSAQVIDVTGKLYSKAYADASLIVSRALTMSLTPPEFVLLHVIMSHTVAMGRESVTMSLNDFAHGVRIENGKVLKDRDLDRMFFASLAQGNLKYSLPTLRKALQGLEEQGYIVINRNRHAKHGGKMPNTITLKIDRILGVGKQTRKRNWNDKPYVPLLEDAYNATDCVAVQ